MSKPARLLILDINGILVNKEYDPTIQESNFEDPDNFQIPKFRIQVRPGLSVFLEKLTEYVQSSKVFFKIGIWTSSNEKTYQQFLPSLFPKIIRDAIIFEWDRSHCQLDPEFEIDPSIRDWDIIKPLDRLLTNPVANFTRKWNDHNVLILDDSERKLRYNPESSRIIRSWDDDLFTIFSDPFFAVF